MINYKPRYTNYLSDPSLKNNNNSRYMSYKPCKDYNNKIKLKDRLDPIKANRRYM